MKTFTMNSMLAVAALTVAAGTAAAQTYKAEIPMTFRAQGAVLSPGAYEFRVISTSGQTLVAMRNVASGSGMTLLSFPGSDAPKAWKTAGRAMVSFVCYGRTCSLSSLWDGRGASTIELPVRKLPAAEAERASIVTLSLARTD